MNNLGHCTSVHSGCIVVRRNSRGASVADCTDVIRVLRAQAWQRAKGELNSMLESFHRDTASPDQFVQLDETIAEFVKIVENHGLQE